MDDHFEEWRRYLPHYLNEADKRALHSELTKFPDKLNYFGDPPVDDLLQGDGWRPFLLFDFNSGARREVAGIIISNSCDIVPANVVDSENNVLFAPGQRRERCWRRLRDA